MIDRRRDFVPAAIVVLLGAVFCVVQIQIRAPDHDNAYLLDISARMLAGERYFRDFLELNPPLYQALLFPVHGLHRLSGLGIYPLFIVYVSIVIVLVTLAILARLRPLLDGGPAERIWIGVAIEATLFFLPGPDFGQRDSVVIMLCLPALLWVGIREPRAPMTPGDWAAVLAACIGMLIKPYLVLVVVLAYGLNVVLLRDWRALIAPPIWLFAGLVAAYAAILVVFFPGWFEVVDLARIPYVAYDEPTWINGWTVRALTVLPILVIANEVFARGADKRLGRTLGAAAVGALVSFVLQHKGWSYHLLPLKLLLWLLLGWVVLAAAKWTATLRRYAALALCVILVLPLYRIISNGIETSRHVDTVMTRLADLLRENQVGPRVANFGTSVYPAYPLPFYRPSLPAWRFAQAWMIPWILQQERAGRGDAPDTRKVIAAQRSMVLEDFRRFRPDGILVDESPRLQAIDGPFDTLAWFRQDPQMAAILDEFERVGEFVDPQSVVTGKFGVYRRRQR